MDILVGQAEREGEAADLRIGQALIDGEVLGRSTDDGDKSPGVSDDLAGQRFRDDGPDQVPLVRGPVEITAGQ